MYQLWSIPLRNRINWCSLLEKLASADIVFFGEVHENPGIGEAELDVLEAITTLCPCSSLFLEMFNYEQQRLLDDYLANKISWNELVEGYSRSREGFNLAHYRYLLDYAKQRGIKVYGIMPPREYAAIVARKGLTALRELDVPVAPNEITYDIPGYRERFYSLIPREGPMAKLDPELLLQAQAFKDQTMAKLLSILLPSCACRPRGLVVTGYAHVEHVGTVPHRLAKYRPVEWLVITSRTVALGGEKRIVDALARDELVVAKIAVLSSEDKGKRFAKEAS